MGGCQFALKPVLLGVNSLSIVSIYAWFRVFDLARASAGGALATFWAVAVVVAMLAGVVVFGSTWKVEWAIAQAGAQIEASEQSKDKAARAAASDRKMELLIRRQVVEMLGKSALLAAIFSVHFAVLESMPLTLEAGLAYAGSVTVLALGVVVAGNFASTLVRFCFCACCCRGTQVSERAFERAKTKTVISCVALVGNCAAWLVGMVYNDMFTRALAEAEARGDIGSDWVAAAKWMLCAGLFAICACVIVLKRKLLLVLDSDGDGDIDCCGLDPEDVVLRCGRCCATGATPESMEAGDKAQFTLSEMVDRSCLYTAMFSLYRALKYTLSPESEVQQNTGELVAALGVSQRNFLIAAIVVTALATALAAYLERAVTKIQDKPDLVHLYDYVADFGMQGMAYIVGRLWYTSITTWVDARGVEHGVDTESILPLSIMALISTLAGLLATVLVRKVFKGATLVRKRAAPAQPTDVSKGTGKKIVI